MNSSSLRAGTFGWFDRALLLATLLTCAVALSPGAADPDLWGHVQYGRDALATGLPATTTYSYTAPGYRWINHENLAELFLACGIDTIGPVGMLLTKCLLGVCLIGLMMLKGLRRGNSLISVCLVAMLVAVNLTYFWSLRPQLFSFLYYGLLIGLLSYCFAGWEARCWVPWFDRRAESQDLTYSSERMRLLWLAPVVLFLWANSHGGFVAGFCIYAAYLSCRCFEALAARGRKGLGIVRRLVMMIVAGGLATLVNPYGPGLHAWLLRSLGSPRPEIVEWHPPEMLSTVMIPLWLILFSWFAIMLLTRVPRDFTHLVIMTIVLWQSMEHVRHIPFFAIAFGFWMVPHVDSVLRRFRIGQHAASFGRSIRPPLAWALTGALCLAFGLLGTKLYERLHKMTVARDQYPVAAFQFIADHDMKGRMIVTYNWAQYALAAFGPRGGSDEGILISFDGRFRTCYPQEIVDMNFDFVLGDLEPRFRGPHSPPFDDERVLEYGRPDLVLLNRFQPHSANVMFRNEHKWVLLYQDKLAQLWGRRDKYDDPRVSHYIAPDQRHISEDEQRGDVAWPAFPVRDRRASQLARGSAS